MLGASSIRAARALRGQVFKTMSSSDGYPAILRDSGGEGYPEIRAMAAVHRR